jgi:hypothetical protein
MDRHHPLRQQEIAMHKPKPSSRTSITPGMLGTPGFPGPMAPSAPALRQQERIQEALGVMSAALDNAASPDFGNAGAALIIRLIRREAASAISVLSPPKERSGHGFKPL